ncbi:adenosine kinase [Synchytrium endobioticum]|uniref:Adenosine kinase n=1 Tax=Synchytrium endobioticum TaxID=286115 RepID=A0A507C3B6_9FUNG|nr:adenosine kinase [Synchytrium endobioticum]TPX47573.1 adenosine kinase [Synchytrium endobioticum]
MSNEYILLGMENPLLDISAVVDMEFLEKYGLNVNDAILAEEKHMPIYEEIQSRYKVDYLAGGAAQNTLRGAQYMLPPKSTVYIGCVGKDDAASILQKEAAKDGLLTEYLVDETAPTGRCAVLITTANRSLVTSLASANNYKISHLKSERIWKIVENAKYYYIGGYFLTVSPDSAMAVAQHAAEKGKTFMMNLSAPFIPKFFGQHVDELMPYIDVLFGNESEADAYADAKKLGTNDVAEIALHIAALPKKTSKPRLVVFTQGTHPTIVAYEGKATIYPIIKVAASKIVDTNGAGDAFCGGFLSQYVQGKSIEQCVAGGLHLASIVVQRSGPTYPQEKSTFSF